MKGMNHIAPKSHGVLIVLEIGLAALSTLQAQTIHSAVTGLHAEEFTVLRSALFDTLAARARPVFSRDGQRLAYLRQAEQMPGTADRSTEVVVVALPAVAPIRTIKLHQPVAGIAWSPDASRIFGLDSHYQGYVIDVGTGQVTALGVVPGARWPGDAMIWADARTVYMFASDYIDVSERLDLETLRSTRIGNRDSAQAALTALQKTPLDNSMVRLGKVKLSLGGIVYTDVLGVSNPDGWYERILYSDPGRNIEGITPSPNAAFAVIQAGFTLRVLALGRRPRPRLGLRASLGPSPSEADPREVSQLKGRLERGYAVFAEVHAPRTNPLNQRVIGGNGPSKGLVRILRVSEDGQLEARFVDEVAGLPEPGDVLQPISSPGDSREGYAKFETFFGIVRALSDSVATPTPVASQAEDQRDARVGSADVSAAKPAPGTNGRAQPVRSRETLDVLTSAVPDEWARWASTRWSTDRQLFTSASVELGAAPSEVWDYLNRTFVGSKFTIKAGDSERLFMIAERDDMLGVSRYRYYLTLSGDSSTAPRTTVNLRLFYYVGGNPQADRAKKLQNDFVAVLRTSLPSR